jgi:hypothetical protein
MTDALGGLNGAMKAPFGVYPMTCYYQIKKAEAPWGDYGDILWNGWATEDGRDRSTITLTRTGPFVPPIIIPSLQHVVVTDEFRAKISDVGFSGLAFEPVSYGRVVRIDWHEWDWNAEDPQFYPESGEPEDYLLAGTHDPELAAAMPRLWAWKVHPTPGLQVQGTNTFGRELHPGDDVARDFFIFWISERMKVWLAENAGRWVSFEPVTSR